MNCQDLLSCAIFDGKSTSVVALRKHLAESPEMSDLWDWFDRRFILAARNREILNAVKLEAIEPVRVPQNIQEHGNALIELLNALKLTGYFINTVRYDYRGESESEHTFTTLMLPTDGIEDEQTKQWLTAILNRRFPRIKGFWDVFCQNWPLEDLRLIEIALTIPTKTLNN